MLVDDDGLIRTIVAAGDSFDSLSTMNIDVVDLDGFFLFPGFEDAHNHPAMMCRQLNQPMLDEVDDWDDVQEHIARYLGSHPDREWTVVTGWHEEWGALTYEHLDTITDRPLFIVHESYHSGVLNSGGMQWLEEQGITVFDDAGRVHEHDFQVVERMTLPTYEELLELIPRFHKDLQRNGTTAVHDMWVSTIDQLRAYKTLDQAHALQMQTSLYVSADVLDHPSIDKYINYVGNRLTIKGGKVYIDGTIGVGTAHLSEPYENDHENHGAPHYTLDELQAHVDAFVQKGITDIAFHAIGDQAVSMALDIVERCRSKQCGIQWRIEHCEIIKPEDIERMVRLGVTPVMQPSYHEDIVMHKDSLGERTQLINPFRSILDAGGPLVFGTDNLPNNPLVGIQYAVHYDHGDERQHITLEEALHAHTQAGATLAGYASYRGSFEVGKFMNGALLNENPFESRSIASIQVLQTYIDGMPVLLNEGFRH